MHAASATINCVLLRINDHICLLLLFTYRRVYFVVQLIHQHQHRIAHIFAGMAAAGDGASSISVTVRVRPFTIREAAQLAKCEDGPLFLGDGSLAAAPTPKLAQKGIRSVIKVVDEKCLYAVLARSD